MGLQNGERHMGGEFFVNGLVTAARAFSQQDQARPQLLSLVLQACRDLIFLLILNNSFFLVKAQSA